MEEKKTQENNKEEKAGHKEQAHKEHNHKKEEHKPADPLKEKDAKIAELQDKYLRALADLDNYRKRVAKDKEDFVKYTRRDVTGEILPVLDNLQRAIAASKDSTDIATLKQGVEIIIKQFEDIIKKLGAVEIKTEGVFDHDLHHVMHKEHKDGVEDGTILEVYQKGYQLDGVVIRPALVKVAVKEEKTEKEEGK